MFGLRHNGAFPLKGIFGRCCPSLSAVRGVASVGEPNGLSRQVPATAWRGELGGTDDDAGEVPMRRQREPL
jgi:hypothetical protein